MAIEKDRRLDPRVDSGARPPSPAEFNTALVHLYRAEVSKANAWRRRLDSTTHWAVLVVAATVSFVFGGTEPDRHATIPLISILITCFLLLEARRYRFYDVFQTRVHLLESDYYAPLLWPDGTPCHPDWQQMLASDLRWPKYHISFWEALGWRLRRNYVWIYSTLLVGWVLKLVTHPTPISSVDQFFQRAAIGPIPGWVLVAGGGLLTLSLLGLVVFTHQLRTASGEIIARNETHNRIRKQVGAEEATELPTA